MSRRNNQSECEVTQAWSLCKGLRAVFLLAGTNRALRSLMIANLCTVVG